MTETVFYRRLMKLCEEKGLSLTALAKEIGKGSATASGWKHGGDPAAGYASSYSRLLRRDHRLPIRGRIG